MQDVNVVVVFYSRFGSTEQLALAAAVGAVQGRANIRLRRLPDAAQEAEIERVPAWKEERERMSMEYVAPRESDLTWADAIVLGIPGGTDDICPEFQLYFDSMTVLRKQGKLEGKIGACFTVGPVTDVLHGVMHQTGFLILPATSGPDALTTARLQGRRVAEAARSLQAVRSRSAGVS